MSDKKIGVTHAIREKLNFKDERLWKRFSARRLELIDTLDLSLKKASEQDNEIKRVAETLRNEFGYDLSYSQDFDKLVRAAIQSVRRNRKRSSKKIYFENNNDAIQSEPKKKSKVENNKTAPGETFFNDVLRNEDEVYDVNYSKAKQFTINDRAKNTIDNIVKPRLPPIIRNKKNESIPPNDIEELKIDCNFAKSILINKIERSKTCNESNLTCKSENLQFLGKNIIASCIGYIFEKSFGMLNLQSIQYLRNKLSSDSSLANIFRTLEEYKTNGKIIINDEIAITSLYTILGGLIIDYGLEDIMYLICEILYVSILHEYPLIVKNSIPFKAQDYMKSDLMNHNNDYTNISSNSLSKLAEVATNLQINTGASSGTTINTLNTMSSTAPSTSTSMTTTNTGNTINDAQSIAKKRVLLKFFNQVIEFFYPLKFQATPKYYELIENVKQVFKLHDCLIIIKYNQQIIQTDFEIEKIFKNTEKLIEFEVFVQNSIPIYEMNQKDSRDRIHLPPPINNQQQRFNFLSNLEDINGSNTSSTSSPIPLPPPQPILPRFQPLL
ncbi:unnamed protein product [Candida verbasci]|uniref:Transcription factor VHR1 n=1 Tax=Candida verbasci TaxID=1227364 RepID=A0A9W4TRH8_9ASCO|nr:unnamed protein product [Candida verbasci]